MRALQPSCWLLVRSGQRSSPTHRPHTPRSHRLLATRTEPQLTIAAPSASARNQPLPSGRGPTMTATLGQLHALAEVDHCLEEGAGLLAQAEERVRAISQAGTSQGHRLMSAQSLKA